MFRGILAVAVIDILSLAFPWQVNDYDCGPTAAAIAVQVVTARRDGIDPGPLSGRFVSLAACQIDQNVDVNDPIGPYLACGACAQFGVATRAVCPDNANVITTTMLDDSESRRPIFVSHPEIDTATKAKAVLTQKNSAIVIARLGHAYVIAQNPATGKIMEIDPFQPYWRRLLNLPLRSRVLDDADLRRVWAGISPGDAAGVRMEF